MIRPVEGPCGTAAEVLEGTVAVERDGLDAFVADEVLDQLDLEALVLGAEDLDRLADGDVAAGELLVGADVLLHRRLDLRQVLLGDLCSGRELEVVVEAGLDRRPDRHLGPRIEVHHRLGHHMGGVVADQLQRLGVTVGEDRHLAPGLGQRRRQVAQLPVDLDRQRSLGEPGADRGRRVGARRPRRQLQRPAVGQGEGGLLGRGLHAGAMVRGLQRAGPCRACRSATRGHGLLPGGGLFTFVSVQPSSSLITKRIPGGTLRSSVDWMQTRPPRISQARKGIAVFFFEQLRRDEDERRACADGLAVLAQLRGVGGWSDRRVREREERADARRDDEEHRRDGQPPPAPVAFVTHRVTKAPPLAEQRQEDRQGDEGRGDLDRLGSGVGRAADAGGGVGERGGGERRRVSRSRGGARAGRGRRGRGARAKAMPR